MIPSAVRLGHVGFSLQAERGVDVDQIVLTGAGVYQILHSREAQTEGAVAGHASRLSHLFINAGIWDSRRWNDWIGLFAGSCHCTPVSRMAGHRGHTLGG